MKVEYSNITARYQRYHHWELLKKAGYKPNLKKRSSRSGQSMHLGLLRNYIENFGLYLKPYYAGAPLHRKIQLILVLGRKRIRQIIESSSTHEEEDYITINEVFDLFCKINLKNEFITYFVTKTQLSFSVFKSQKIKAASKGKRWIVNSEYEQLKHKFAQFIYCILVEYIVLHNLMFASNYRLPDVHSIDDLWLRVL